MPNYVLDEFASRPLGMAGLGAAAPPAALVRLPNGIAIDPAAISAHMGIPVSAILAAASAVWRARSLAEGQDLVDQVEAQYGLAPSALDAISASLMPVAQAPAAQMRGMGLGWHDIVDAGKSAVGTVVDATTAVATGGASLLLPGNLQPGQAVTNTGGWIRDVKTEAVPAVFDGAKWIANAGGLITGKTLMTAGNLLKNFNQPATPAPAAPVRQASIFGGSLTPWLIGAGILAAVLLTRKGHSHTT